MSRRRSAELAAAVVERARADRAHDRGPPEISIAIEKLLVEGDDDPLLSTDVDDVALDSSNARRDRDP